MEAIKIVQPSLSAERIRQHAVRMLALVDLVKATEPDAPPVGDESTDGADKLQALLHCLRFEPESLHADASEKLEATHV